MLSNIWAFVFGNPPLHSRLWDIQVWQWMLLVIPGVEPAAQTKLNLFCKIVGSSPPQQLIGFLSLFGSKNRNKTLCWEFFSFHQFISKKHIYTKCPHNVFD